jgi:hypothetical protein
MSELSPLWAVKRTLNRPVKLGPIRAHLFWAGLSHFRSTVQKWLI